VTKKNPRQQNHTALQVPKEVTPKKNPRQQNHIALQVPKVILKHWKAADTFVYPTHRKTLPKFLIVPSSNHC
jgi:hypothetical protein